MMNTLAHERRVDTASAAVPVACIGMSVGGLEPLRTLFRNLPIDTGMAFIVLHHLRRKPTHLPELLRSHTVMPVLLATKNLPIRSNHVYVLGSGTEIILKNGELLVKPAHKMRGWSDVMTTFLLSLTGSKHPGIAVILSGLDHDGAAALKAFKQHGEITIVQNIQTAERPDMPHSAIRTGAVDYQVPPEAIAPLLENIAARYRKAKGAEA